MLRIRVGRTEILGRPDLSRVRVEGLFVAREGFEGWDDSPETRRDSVDRPGQDGQYDVPVLLASRVFSIDGWALAWSESDLGRLRSVVTGICAGGIRERVIVDHQGESLWSDIRSGGKATFKDAGVRHGLHRARFLLQFVAPDPRKYGAENTYPSGFVRHYGNFPAIPVVEVTGAMGAGYAIHGPEGRRFVVTQPLLSGQTHRIDMRTGRLYRDGVLQIGAVSNGGTWTIPPAKAVPMTLVPVVGGGVMTVKVLDTFI